MSAFEIAQALNGKKSGAEWMVRCPAHSDQHPSLSIRDGDHGKLLVNCHAGCDGNAVMAALRSKGLLAAKTSFKPAKKASDAKAAVSPEYIAMLWGQSIGAEDTPTETYLHSRGFQGIISADIRHHLSLKHTPSKGSYPAMLAAVRDCKGNLIGLHRTYLAMDGSCKAPVEPNKMMLGPCLTGAVHLHQCGEKIVISEGIETGMSVQMEASLPCWAALSANGIKALILPPLPLAAEVIIAADNDARGTGYKAALLAAQRFMRDGRVVRIAMPPNAGSDFNDLLINKNQPKDSNNAN